MKWLWWIVGTFGVGGTILAVIGLTVGWPLLFTALRTTVGRAALAVAAFAGLLLAVFLKGRREGRAAEKARQDKIDRKIIKEATDDQKDVADLSGDDVDRELRNQSKR